MSETKESPYPPRISIMLDRERELQFPVPSIWQFEDLTGLDILNGGVTGEEEFYGGTKECPATMRQRLNRLIDLIWAGLLADDPTITRDYVARHVYPRDLKALDKRCADAFFAALNPAKSEGEKSGPLTKAAAGRPSAVANSGRSRAKS